MHDVMQRFSAGHDLYLGALSELTESEIRELMAEAANGVDTEKKPAHSERR